jgi:ribosomal protein L37AE/L43A
MEFLRRLHDAWLRLTPTSHVLEYADDCPHCDERTTWTIRILNGYIRCQQCRRNPLRNGDFAPAEQSDQTRPRSESHVPA